MPVLYQWFRLYYQSLLNKFSILMHDSLPNDVDHIMNDKNETFLKMSTFVKKTQPCFVGILLDASRSMHISFRGTRLPNPATDKAPNVFFSTRHRLRAQAFAVGAVRPGRHRLLPRRAALPQAGQRVRQARQERV